MAGATNRAFKAAGLPKATRAEIRVERGGGLTVRSAIQHAQAHGLPLGKAKAGNLTGWDKAAAGVKVTPQAEDRQYSQMRAAAAQIRAAGKPAAGHVHVNRGGQITSEKEVHSRGPFAVHREGEGFAVTHKPTGMSMAKTKTEATAREIVNGMGESGQRISDRMMAGDAKAATVFARYARAQGSKGQRLAAAHRAKVIEAAKRHQSAQREQLIAQNAATAKANAANRQAAAEYWKPSAPAAKAAPGVGPFTVAHPPPSANRAAPTALGRTPSTGMSNAAQTAVAERNIRGAIRGKIKFVRAADASVRAARSAARSELTPAVKAEFGVVGKRGSIKNATSSARRASALEERIDKHPAVIAAEQKARRLRASLNASLSRRNEVATSRATKARLERAGQQRLF